MNCYPWGDFQTLVFGDQKITFTPDHFASQDGSTFLDQYGCFRSENSEYLKKPEYGPLMTTHYTGPINGIIPFAYRWNLQLLSDELYYCLDKMVRTSRGQGVLLYDGFLALATDAPRTRAGIGSAIAQAPTIPNVEFFYPQFMLDLVLDSERSQRWEYGWDAALIGIERDPDQPIPVIYDVLVVP